MVIASQPLATGLDDCLRSPAALLAEHLEKHDRVKIDPIDDPP